MIHINYDTQPLCGGTTNPLLATTRTVNGRIMCEACLSAVARDAWQGWLLAAKDAGIGETELLRRMGMVSVNEFMETLC